VAEPAFVEPAPGAEDPSIDALFAAFLVRASQENGGRPPGLRAWVDLAEAWRIVHALRACAGNRSAGARALGIGRRTLYTKMEKLGITPTYSFQGVDLSSLL
jgi:transcriptional regulator of acetoin/glycerol metabolism